MRTTAFLAVIAVLLGGRSLAQDNPITNGGFETLDAQGHPVDWEFLGDCSITEDAHSGKHAVLLQRSSPEGICGLNRVWEFLFNAQGEDVVAGIRTPLPISELEKQMPEKVCGLPCA